MSVLDYVEPLHVKEGKELQDFERQIFGGRAADNKNPVSNFNDRLDKLTAENKLLKSNLATMNQNLPFLPKDFPDIPDYFFQVSPVNHPVFYAFTEKICNDVRIAQANYDSCLAWKARADDFEKVNLDWVAHGKNQDAQISELVRRVNDLNAANATFVKANAALKKQVIFSSLMVLSALMPTIVKWFS